MSAQNKKQALKERTAALFNRACQQEDKGEFRSAFRCFLSAAKLGDTSCQINLGNYYDAGTGVKRDLSKAIYWYKRAIKKGDSTGANNLGITYRLEKDFDKALYWLNRAVAMGEVASNLWIAKVFIENKNEPKRAIPYLKRVCKGRLNWDVSIEEQREAARILKRITRPLKKK